MPRLQSPSTHTAIIRNQGLLCYRASVWSLGLRFWILHNTSRKPNYSFSLKPPRSCSEFFRLEISIGRYEILFPSICWSSEGDWSVHQSQTLPTVKLKQG